MGNRQTVGPCFTSSCSFTSRAKFNTALAHCHCRTRLHDACVESIEIASCRPRRRCFGERCDGGNHTLAVLYCLRIFFLVFVTNMCVQNDAPNSSPDHQQRCVWPCKGNKAGAGSQLGVRSQHAARARATEQRQWQNHSERPTSSSGQKCEIGALLKLEAQIRFCFCESRSIFISVFLVEQLSGSKFNRHALTEAIDTRRMSLRLVPLRVSVTKFS